MASKFGFPLVGIRAVLANLQQSALKAETVVSCGRRQSTHARRRHGARSASGGPKPFPVSDRL